MKGNMVHGGERKRFFTKIETARGGKRLENHQKSNLCLWRGKVKVFLTKTDGDYPRKKAGKIIKKAICAYEGGYVDMKRKSEVFWLKLLGITLGKRLENHEKSNLCLWRAICAHEGEQ